MTEKRNDENCNDEFTLRSGNIPYYARGIRSGTVR